MGLFDFFKDTKDALGSSFWPSVIQTGGALVGGLLGSDNDYEQAYGNTEEGFKQTLAFEREKLAQALEIARANAGASVAAARVSAGAQVASANIARDSRMRELLSKERADALAYKLDAKKSGIIAISKAQENIQRAKEVQAQLMGTMYSNAASTLSRFAK